MHRHPLIAACCALGLGTPLAADTCDMLTGWAAQAGAAHSAEVRAPQDILQGANPPACAGSMAMSGAVSVHCAWGFAYRAQAATDAFAQLDRALTTCFGPQIAAKGAKKQVNHPDSYDLRQFQARSGRIMISLKDKGGLQETYVFLRASGRLE